MSGAPMEVVIVGRGLAASMAAVQLVQALPSRQVRVSVLAIPAVGDGDPEFGVEATLPGFAQWNARYGISEEALVRQGCASFSLGTAYSGWSAAGGSTFQPFGEIGSALEGVAFHQLAERLRQAGVAVRLADFSIAAMAAQAGRFGRPSPDPRSPLSLLDYGLHLDRKRTAELLLRKAGQFGANLPTAGLSDLVVGKNGEVEAAILDDGSRVSGDLWIDASASAAVLSSKLPGSAWVSWDQWLPATTVVAMTRRSAVPPAPYAHVVAEAIGWRRIVPTQERFTETIAGDESAPAVEQTSDVEGFARFRLEQGRRAEAWVGNCIALGTAATMLEPTAPFELHLVQRQLEGLVRLFPAGAGTAAERREFNRHFAQEADRARDFVIARAILCGHHGRHWDRVRAMTPPAELAAKIALFRSRGRVPLLEGEPMEEADWASLFDQLGVRAHRVDALADALPIERLQAQLTRMRQVMIAAVAPLPLHGEVLAGLARRQAA